MVSFIASIIVVNGWDGDYQTSILSKDAKLYGWLAIQYTMIAMPFGMLIINLLHGYISNHKLFLSYINSPIITSTSRKDTFVKYPLYILSLISLLSIIYTFISLKTIPIIAAFQGLDASSLAALRQQAYREFEGSDTIRNIFGIALTPILSYIAYAYWCLTKSIKDFLWFLILFVFSFFILTFDLSKAPIVFFILGFLFLNVLINGGIKKKTLFFFGVASLALIVSAYVIVARLVDFKIVFNAIGGRIIFGQAAGTFFSFEYFPSTHDFIGFSSISKNLSLVFGTDLSERAARIIMTIFNPSGIEAGKAGVMNSLFIAEAWANWGLFGVIIAPVYLGMFVQIIYMFFLKTKKTPIMLGLLTYLSYKLPITGGFNDFIYDRNLMLIFIIFISIYIAALFLKDFDRRNVHEDNLSLSTSD